MKFTVIIAVMNGEKYLGRCLNSVLSQTWPEYEIIVRDGGSTDGTPDILKTYSRRINWRAEPDDGIYDAWNKALEAATGDWAVFLGADDFLIATDVFERSRECLATLPPHVDFAYGNLALGTDGRPVTRIVNTPLAVYSGFFKGVGLPFPATFVRVETLRKYGFDPSYKIAGDYEFTVRCLMQDNIAHLPHYVAFMEHGGVSDSPASAVRLTEERARVLREAVIPKAELIASLCLAHIEDAVEE